MNKIKKLINETCPNGVEWKELGEIIISLKTGLNPRKNFVLNTPDAKNYYITVRGLEGVDILFLDKTDLVNDDGLKLINNRSNLEVGDILFSGSGTIGKTALIQHKPENWNISEGVYTIKPKKSIIVSKFLLFFLNSYKAMNQIINFSTGSIIKMIQRSLLKKIKIPIPPLEIQKEIVEILDKFTRLKKELERELKKRKQQYEYYRDDLLSFEDDVEQTITFMKYKEKYLIGLKAELAARKKQYEYYRDDLLNFGDDVDLLSFRDDVEWKELGEVCKILIGEQLNKTELKKFGKYPAYNGGMNYSGFTNKYNVDENTTIISQGGSAGFVRFVETKFWANLHCYYLKPNFEFVENKFLFYFVKNKQEYLINSRYGGGIPALRKSTILKIPIPIPPLKIQKEIVQILDKFNALVNDTSIGLPAEIAARKKQYEYYLNNLLSFKDGVEWKELGEILDYEYPTNFIVKSTNYDDDYQTPVLTAGKSFIIGKTNEVQGIFKANKDNPVIIFDDFATLFHWVDFDFKVKSSAMKIIKPKQDIGIEIDFRFVYFAMRCIKYIPNNHSRYWISKYSHFKIPIPPIKIQKEIVEILDKLDVLINDTSIGLQAELTARKKQYEYYMNKLLGF